ncbi:MAG: hypothetical protein JO347_02085 [Candidatus Eremiobacteraeota bacterium]|nr:hypothetical protein [Candidatus Eremiobacteraeota bacterium]
MSLEDRIKGEMQRIARYIKAELPADTFFVLLAGRMGAGARLQYVANAKRSDVVALMHEFITATKGNWGEHAKDDDSELARLRQRVSELELEISTLQDELFEEREWRGD